MAEKTRYSDEELEEFREIINEKLRLARRDFNSMMEQLRNTDGNGIEDTSPTYKALEEVVHRNQKKRLHRWLIVSKSSLWDWEAALVRVENKTYGIDCMTGELIPKERLRVVPHATLSVASKNARKK